MSTKIYEAYRIPSNKLNDFLLLVRQQYLEQASKKVNALMDAIKPEYLEEERQKRLNKGLLGEINDSFDRYYILSNWLLEASESTQKSMFDIDCSLNVWVDRSKAYAIPYGNFKLENLPAWVEDYSYWNNSNKPDDITNRQWNQRAKTWDRVCLQDWNKTRLNYEIVNYSELVGKFEIEDILEIYPKHK